MSSRHHSHGDQNMLFWKPDTIIRTSLARKLGWQPDIIIKYMLEATTKYVSTVEAEMHDVPQHHLSIPTPSSLTYVVYGATHALNFLLAVNPSTLMSYH